MRSLLLLFISVLFFSANVNAQAIVKGSGIVYTNGAPTHTVNVNADAEVAIDTTSGYWYERSRDGLGWILAGFRVQKFPFSIAPTAAPLDKQSEVLLNDVDSLYRWRSGAWRHLNPDGSIMNEGILGVGAGGASSSTLLSNTSGANPVTINAAGILAITESTSSNGGSITLTATEIDGSITNEGLLGVGAGGASSSVLLSNTSGAAGVTINVAGINAITESTSANGGSITITATEVDGSVSNELQTIANTSNATTHTATLSNSGGSLQLAEGSGITLTTSGTGLDGVVTIAATTQATDLTFTGAGSPYTLNSSTGTDVTFTQGAGITITRSSNDLSFAATDASATNELQTLASTSDATSHTATLSNSGGSIKLVEGANITLTTSGTGLDGVVTIASSGGAADGNGFYSGNGGNGGDGTIPSLTTSTITNQFTFLRATDDVGGFVPVRISVPLGNEPDFLSLVNGSDSLLFSKADQEFEIDANKRLVVRSTDELYLIADSINISTIPTGFDNEATLLFMSPAGTIVKAEGLDPDIIRQNGATDGQVLKWNNTTSNWEPANDASGAGSTDLTFTGAGSPYTLNSSTGTDVTFAEGAGITLSRVTNELTITAVDQSATNEAWTVDADDLETEVISNQTLKFQGAGITATDYDAATNVLLITSTEVDGSTTNELQTIANTSNATSHTATLSNTGGSVQFVEGTGIGLATTGTGLDGILTITNTAPDQTVSITGAGISVVTGTYPSFTITSTEVDGSITNEGLLGVGAGGATSSVLLSNTSTAAGVTINVAGINAISETTSANGGQITITATEVDGSTTNELQTIANTSNSTTHTATLSNSGGSLQLAEGSGITLTTSGTGLDGVVTIAATTQATDLTFTGAGSPYTLNSSTGTDVTFTQGTGITITRSTNDLSFAATDGSTTNELQTIANTSNATSHTATLSNSGGSLQLAEGTGITLTTSGTGLDGVVTIASTISSPVANNGLSDNENSGNFRLGNRYMNSSDGLFSFERKININAFKFFVGDNTDSTLLNIDGTNDRVGVHTTAPGRTFSVNGEVEIKDLVTTNPSLLVGVDANGVLSEVTLGTGLSYTGTTLNATGGGGGDVLNNGNSFAAAFIVGSNDNNTVSLEQNGTTVVTIGTDKNITATNSVAATNTVTDQLKLNINSTGTAANSFGNGILFSGESSTTNDREMARQRVYWTTATDASREAAFSWMLGNNAGALAEVLKMDVAADDQGALIVGSANTLQIDNDQLTPTTDFIIGAGSINMTFGNTSGLVNIGNSSGLVQLLRSSLTTNASVPFILNSSSTNTTVAGFGSGLQFVSQAGLVGSRDIALIDAIWTNATDATRTSDIVFSTVNSATTNEAFRIYGNKRAMVGGGTNQASAALQVTSTTGGFLGPKGTDANMTSIASPVEGLEFWNTTVKGKCVYDGTNWMRLSCAQTPTVTVGTGAGTGASASVVGNDLAGVITVTAGTTPATNATVVTLDFHTDFNVVPRSVTITAGDEDAQLILYQSGSTRSWYCDKTAITVDEFIIKSGSTANNAVNGTAYEFHYQVGQ